MHNATKIEVTIRNNGLLSLLLWGGRFVVCILRPLPMEDCLSTPSLSAVQEASMGADDCGLSPMTGVQRCEEHEEKAPAAECLCDSAVDGPNEEQEKATTRGSFVALEKWIFG